MPATTSSTTPGSSKENIGSETCGYCGSKLHAQVKCYYLHRHIRPAEWKPMQGKEHFMKNHKRESAKAVRAMKVVFLTRITDKVS